MQLKITSGPNAGQTVEVTGNEFTIGREAGVDLVIPDGKASRRHAALKPLPDGRATLYDLGSSNGTFVNGQRIQSTVLNGNEQIQIGDTVMVPLVEQPAGAGAGGATSVGSVPPPAAPQPAVPPAQQFTPPTQPIAPVAPQQQQQPVGGFQPPTQTPIQRPSRTQSAIQRIMLQRAVTRATWVGIAAIVIALGVGAAALLGVFSSDPPKRADASDVIPTVEQSTVLVVNDKGGGSGGRGTGWVWDAAQGLVVTNAHVTAGGQNWSVATGRKIAIQPDESGALSAGDAAIPAERIGEALCEDIAVLKVEDASTLKTIKQLPQNEDLEIGDPVIAVGYPSSLTASENPTLDADLTGDTGDVAQPHTTFPAIPGEGPDDPSVGPYQDVLQTSTVINQGNSGGPLINFDAELVGMNTAKNNENVGQNYAITIQRIREIVPKLIAGENVCGTTGGE
jgi:S1-C subfamily serine protease